MAVIVPEAENLLKKGGAFVAASPRLADGVLRSGMPKFLSVKTISQNSLQ